MASSGKSQRVSLCLLLPFLLGACGKKDSARPQAQRVTIAALFDRLDTPIREEQIFLLRALAQTRAGSDLNIKDAAGNAAKQAVQLAEAIAAKPQFLLVFPIDAAAITPALAQAKTTGTKVFVFSDAVPDTARTAALVCTDREIGRTAGEFVLRALRQKAKDEGSESVTGRIAQFTVGPPARTAESTARITSGLVEAIAAEPGIKLVHDAPCTDRLDWTVPARVGEALRLQKDFEIVFAHSDSLAGRVAKVITQQRAEMRHNILVLGIGGTMEKPGGNAMVVASEIDATIYEPPLVDAAWMLILKCLENPAFAPKPRYEIKPEPVNLETALELAIKGRPYPTIE